MPGLLLRTCDFWLIKELWTIILSLALSANIARPYMFPPAASIRAAIAKWCPCIVRPPCDNHIAVSLWSHKAFSQHGCWAAVDNYLSRLSRFITLEFEKRSSHSWQVTADNWQVTYCKWQLTNNCFMWQLKSYFQVTVDK